MVRKQLRGANLPQLHSSDYLSTDVMDANYEEENDDYTNRHNRGSNWHGRAYRAGRYARGAYDWGQNYSRGITPAMENGASAAIGTLGTVASHTNPFRPWKSFAFWSMGIGTLIVGGWVAQFFLGGLIATRNPRQLPQNAPTAVRFGHGVVNAGKPVAAGVWNGFGTVATGAGDSLDKAVRLNSGTSDDWQQPRVTVQQAQQSTTTLPLTNWTGAGRSEGGRE
ncbi:hypothetical protein DSM106972_048150 [Dulcicalothrix desertica PCC 7102]|uniref:Uncharacterized protein n=1 Tax=Dulcicalothrix desertica PCC 7102 TaxID=232991 RepID=A0A433VCR4_9CYAN|nr:hypothetical protein [Dulcicalothrix desertica]RUT03901.1 hypothetical protein DSM106972_048150 [Dulcicalothrix desertica PCC 7102]TWH43690.1 hypothetical protein CAL7102_07433 [Dulcicalothrix desertica PCC 7102]